MRFFYFTFTSSLLILAVLAIRSLFRQKISPAVMYALWLFPVLRLMMPFGVMELSGSTAGEQLLTAPYMIVEEMISALQDSADEEAAPKTAADLSDSQEEAAAAPLVPSKAMEQTPWPAAADGAFSEPDLQRTSVSAAEKITKSGSFRMTGWQMFQIVWLCGSVVMGAYVLFSNQRLRRSVRHMEMEQQEGMLPVCFSNAVVSPCLFGLFRPRILVNRKVQDDPELFRQVMRHETAHYRQKDHIWTALRIALCIVYWWNPLIWLAAACAKEDAELSCDYRVTQGMNVQEKKAYGMALLKLLAGSGGGLTILYGATSMSGNTRNMKRRIGEIAHQTITDKAVLAPLVLALAAGLLMGCSVRDTFSYMKVLEVGSGRTEEGGMSCTAQWEYSYQEPLQHRLYYYEVYHYGELIDRHLLAVGNIGDDRKAKLGLSLVENTEQEKSLTVHFDWGGVTADCPVELSGVQSNISGNNMNQPGDRYEIRPGDDLILAAQCFGGLMENSLSVPSCDTLMEYEKEDRLEEQISDTYIVVLVRCILSDQDNLSDMFMETMEYPGGTSEEQSDAETLVKSWALGFADRDSDQMIPLMSEDLKAVMLKDTAWEDESLFLELDDGRYSFGWSSPWPMGGEDSFRIVMSDDGQSAEVYYYAWDSTPHIYVWKETLGLEETDGEWKVSSEEIQYFTNISTREEFYEAYPDGVIDGTPMDYKINGFGETLNNHAVNRSEEVYTGLLEPMKAAQSLLNLENVSVRLTDFPTEGVERSVPVEITFLEDGSVVNLWMYQPAYDVMGLWIPASADPNAELTAMNAAQQIEAEPLAEEILDPNSDYQMADLTYVEPQWAKQYTDLSGWDENRLENTAQKALQELYDLTGYQVESCVYTSTGNGDFTFAKTADDMEHSRTFYSRQFHNQKYENTIPSLYLSSARRVWYSDVQQLLLPENVEKMSGEALAQWYVEQSGLYREGIDPDIDHAESTDLSNEIYRVVLSDRTFYEVQLDRKINGVDWITGPYPEGFEH